MKKALRYFLELRFFPELHLFLFNNETWLRIRPLKLLLQNIDPRKKKKIIDVGGGIGHLELMMNRTDIYIYDLDAKSIEIAKQNFENAIVGTGSNISYNDNSFDWAISIHTLEHIPKTDREKFILEMIRVSSEGIYLNFPEGEFAEALCKNYLHALEKNGKEPNKWTLEHLAMGLPLALEINDILKKQDKFKFSYKLIRNYNSENTYWTKNRASESLVKSYFLSPIQSIKKFLFYNKAPNVEMILVGTKEVNSSDDLLIKLISK